jgi:hypothetical protein
MTTAGQRAGKRIPEVTLSTTEGHPVPGNTFLKTEVVFYVVRAETARQLRGNTPLQ